MMTPAASVAFARREFDDFLYASIDEQGNGMPLSVLSALARLNLDPWEEAANLSELPTSTATQRLVSLIARLPGERWAQTDMRAIAARLVELLPCRGSFAASFTEKPVGLREMTGSTIALILLCVALGITLMTVAVRERSPPDNHADVPAFNRGSPPQSQ